MSQQTSAIISGIRARSGSPASGEQRLVLGLTASLGVWAVLAAAGLGEGLAVAWGCLSGALGVIGSALAPQSLRLLRGRALPRPSREPRRVGPYVLEEKIGEGGMGVVYRGRHGRLGRRAAIKLLRPDRARDEDRRRFEREVQFTSRLSHPNIVSVLESGRTETGTIYCAMEYVEGVDLQTLVEREGPQDPRRVARLLAQLCGALSEVHRLGFIHRDIKPANAVLSEDRSGGDLLTLLDFGLVREMNGGSDREGEVRRIVGTPLYLSPEALTEPSRMDGRSDLYSVGALGYYLLTGVPPFSGGSLLEVCAHHLHSRPVPPSARTASDIPGELESLILRCLSKAMDDRPADAVTLEQAFARLATPDGMAHCARAAA